MRTRLLLICMINLLQVSLMAQPTVSEIPVHGGGVMSVELPIGVIIYENHDQNFTYRVDVGKTGEVKKIVFHYGKEFNQNNVDPINRSLMKWKFHPSTKNGEITETGFYITISLINSPADGRPRMIVSQGILKLFDSFLPIAEVQEMSDERRKALIPEYQDYKYPKGGIESILSLPK